MRDFSLDFRWILCVTAAVIAGGVLRFGGLDHLELWFDENCTYYISHHFFDWPTAGPDPFLEVAHVPYFFLLSIWTSFVGETAWGLRSFSAFIGTLTILLVGFVGFRLSGNRVGLVASILASVHPLHIHYSQEARVYSLWALVSLAMIYALMVAVRSGRRMRWVLFIVAAWCVVLTHYYALLLLPATVCAVLAVEDRGRALRQWCVAILGLGVLLVPVLVLFVLPHAERGPKGWLAEVWGDGPGLIAVVKSIWAMLPAGRYPSYLGGLAGWEEVAERSAGSSVSIIIRFGSILLILAVCAVYAIGRVRGASRENISGIDCQPEISAQRDRVTFSLGMMTICFLLVAMLYSHVVGPAYVAGRYDFVVWPVVILALSGAIESAGARVCRTGRGRSFLVSVVVVFLSGCSLATTLASRQVSLVQGSDARAELIASQVGSGDLVVSVNQFRWFVTHGLLRRRFSASVVSFPTVHNEQICWRNAEAEFADRDGLEADADSITRLILGKLSGGGRTWLMAHGRAGTTEFEVDQVFLAKLMGSGLEIRPVDDWSGLAELVSVPVRK